MAEIEMMMSRIMGGSDNDSFRLTIEDRLSGTTFLEVKLSPADLADLLSTRTCRVDAQLDVTLVGKRREHKVEQVFVPSISTYDRDARREMARSALFNHEIDGWKGRVDDALNSHRLIKYIKGEQNGAVYSVNFTRWVDVDSVSTEEE